MWQVQFTRPGCLGFELRGHTPTCPRLTWSPTLWAVTVAPCSSSAALSGRIRSATCEDTTWLRPGSVSPSLSCLGPLLSES